MYGCPSSPSTSCNVMPKKQSCPQRKVFTSERYDPLDFSKIQGYPHFVPRKNIEYFPKFRDLEKLASQHVQGFIDLMEDCQIEEEDAIVKFFVRTLEGIVEFRFSSFPMHSICSWQELEILFMDQFGKVNNECSSNKRNLHT